MTKVTEVIEGALRGDTVILKTRPKGMEGKRVLVLLLEEEDEKWRQWESMSEDERVEKLKEELKDYCRRRYPGLDIPLDEELLGMAGTLPPSMEDAKEMYRAYILERYR